MRCYQLALGIFCSFLAQAEEVPRAIEIADAAAASPAAGQVTSRSGQFRIYGGDGLTRASAALLTEEAKDELLRMLDETDQWGGKIPITLHLHGKPGDPMPFRTLSIRLHYSEAGYDLRLDAHLCRGLEIERFKFTTTSCLLYERALRNSPPSSPDQQLTVPPWLVDGLREASDWRLDRSDRKLYAALFKRGGLFKISDLFSISTTEFEEIDAATRAAFRVSSGALVMALLEQPQGKAGFRAFLSEVATFEGEMPTLLRKHFPELNLSETSLEKWWGLQLANKGGLNPLTEVLPIQQTESDLTELLKLHFLTPEGIALPKELSAWPELSPLKEAERNAATRPTQEALVRLSYRCFPSYRPIIAEYQLILLAIASQKTDDIASRLASVQESRTTMLAKAHRARDFLDWFEITRARETSGVFDDYMRLKERLKANPFRRKDALSTYLDRMDAIFCRGLPAMAPAADESLAFPSFHDLPLPE